MDAFKPIIKMKTGGSVSKAVAAHEKKEMRAGAHSDIVEDKKLVKKAINLHDDQLHEGAKTDLSTLKKGGRCKKSGGTIRKYAAGGLTDPALQSVLNADALRKRRAAAPAAPLGQPVPPNIGATAGMGVQPGGTTMKCGGRTKKK